MLVGGDLTAESRTLVGNCNADVDRRAVIRGILATLLGGRCSIVQKPCPDGRHSADVTVVDVPRHVVEETFAAEGHGLIARRCGARLASTGSPLILVALEIPGRACFHQIAEIA